ncbi:MAG TPA: hypothetical protein DHV28_17700 [Ignavibacteriales bacterium]|nr:hypothetical protein [Ignavibacteriales bacterium]
MNSEKTKKMQSDQFKINVNNIVVLLLNQKTLFFNTRSASCEAVNLIKEKFGLCERQAKLYLQAARKEILRVTEMQKEHAIKEVFKQENLVIHS